MTEFRQIGGGAAGTIGGMSAETGPATGPNAPTVAIAVEDRAVREALAVYLQQRGVLVETLTLERRELLEAFRRQDADVIVIRRSQIPSSEYETIDRLAGGADDPGIVVLADEEDAGDRVRLMAAGVSQVLQGSRPQCEIGDAIQAIAGAEADGTVGTPEVRGSRPEPRIGDFFSRSPRMLEFLELVRKVVDRDSSLLILGETGVGKERLARAIHTEGPRAVGPFLSVNIGALSENLLEAELFGHEAGAFTGADRTRRGQFELASGGTILLDEIGEMPAHLQVKLLTVLQRHEVRRVGGNRPIPIDVRVMAATNRDLSDDVRDGRFREDLFYRLNVVPLAIPPLRERKEDIPDLVGRFINHFRRDFQRRQIRGITDAALQILLQHDWPGNTRELINVIERAMLLCEGSQITLADLPPFLRKTGAQAGSEAVQDLGDAHAEAPFPSAWLERPLRQVRKGVIERFEKAYLIAQLRATGGRVGETARRSGLAPRSLHDKMKRYDLRKKDFRVERSQAAP